MNTKQERRYQEKLEDRRSSILCCEGDKKEIKQALKNSDQMGAYRVADRLWFFARDAVSRRIGGLTNFHGYMEYADKIMEEAA